MDNEILRAILWMLIALNATFLGINIVNSRKSFRDLDKIEKMLSETAVLQNDVRCLRERWQQLHELYGENDIDNDG